MVVRPQTPSVAVAATVGVSTARRHSASPAGLIAQIPAHSRQLPLSISQKSCKEAKVFMKTCIEASFNLNEVRFVERKRDCEK